MEGELRKLLQFIKEAGGTASLTFFVRGGKTKAKLEVDLDSEPAPTSSTPASAPRPRRRRRRQARGAPQPGAPSGSPPPSVPEGEAGGSPRPHPLRPLKHLPAASDGRQLFLHVGRPAAMLSFASLNTDGPPPSLPPRPPPPPPPALQSVSTVKLRRQRLKPEAETAFNKLPLSDRIAILSAKGIGVERFRWQLRRPLWPKTPPWHSSSPSPSSSCSSSSSVARCSSSDSSACSSWCSESDSDECFE